MNEVADTIEATVVSNGGSATWQQMIDAVPFQGRKWIVGALRLLKEQNRVRQVVDGTVTPPTHRLVIPSQV